MSSPAKAIADTNPAPKTAEKPADLASQVQQLVAVTSKLSPRNTAKLNKIQGEYKSLKKQCQDTDEAILTGLQEIEKYLQAKQLENDKFQQELLTTSNELIEKLSVALEEGQSQIAMENWDRIQGNISNTSGKTRNQLLKSVNPFKEKLDELRDWKVFAATEKKKELIEQMRNLPNRKLTPPELSRTISKMHKDWKNLGRSNENERMWKQFKKLSDLAYTPCKEFFKQRKIQMAENLVKRRNICEQLDKALEEIDKDNVNISQLNKLVSEAERDWKQYAPVEQSKIKTLQKRYYGLVNQLRKLRKENFRDHAQAKQGLIDKAKALLTEDDNRQAMEAAKGIQREWKQIGPTSFKEDRKYWEDFRAICDQIFAKGKQEKSVKQKEFQQTDTQLADSLKQLQQLAEISDDELRARRNDVKDISQQFNLDLDNSGRKQRDQWLEKFNTVKRKIDFRLKSLPDKKQLEEKNAITSAINAIRNLEQSLWECTDEAAYPEHTQQLQEYPLDDLMNSQRPSNTACYDLLQKRLQSYKNIETRAQLEEVATKAEHAFRRLCIELEIRAGIESPAEDQAARMEIQLQQLKDVFGHAKPNAKQNAKFVFDLEMRSLCIGPLEPKTSSALQDRLQAAIAKLR